MAALWHRGRVKSVLHSSCSRVLSGRIANNQSFQNGTNPFDLQPESKSCGIYLLNRNLSSLSANSLVLQHQQRHYLRSAFSTCFVPTRNKSLFNSVSVPENDNKSFRSPLAKALNDSSLLLPDLIYSLGIQCRFKKKNRNNKLQEEEDFSDDEVDELQDEEFEEETNLPLNYKEFKIKVKSPRADTLLSTGLNISRAKIDSMFYGSKLLHNDKPLTKKSKNLYEGDYVDMKMENAEDVKVKRVKVLKITSEKGPSEKLTVVIRAWRIPFSLETIGEDE